jgi:hypothetical protein
MMKKITKLILLLSLFTLSITSCNNKESNLNCFLINNKTDLHDEIYQEFYQDKPYGNTYHRSQLDYIKLGNSIFLFQGTKSNRLVYFHIEIDNQKQISRRIISKNMLYKMMNSENAVLQKTTVFFSDDKFRLPYYQVFFHDYILCKYCANEIEIINMKNGIQLHKELEYEEVIYDAKYIPDEEELRFISFSKSTKMDYHMGTAPTDVILHIVDLEDGTCKEMESNQMIMKINNDYDIEYKWYSEGKQIANLISKNKHKSTNFIFLIFY